MFFLSLSLQLKTLQTAHERELAACHETVRLLQQRLNERDEQFAMQKRRKVPVDYYALKAKVCCYATTYYLPANCPEQYSPAPKSLNLLNLLRTTISLLFRNFPNNGYQV